MQENNFNESELRDELESKFQMLKLLIDESKKASKKISEDITKAKAIRDQKKEIVDKVKKGKTERSKIQENIKGYSSVLKPLSEEKKSFGDIKSAFGLKKEIKRIEWKIWTEPMNYKKEEELVKMRKELEAELKKSEEYLEKFKDEKNARNVLMDSIRAQRKIHEEIVSESQRWEGLNAEGEKISKRIDENKAKKNEIDSKLGALKVEISKIKEILGLRENEERSTSENRQKSAIKNKVEEIRERFKKTGKLTTEDLIVLSASGESIV